MAIAFVAGADLTDNGGTTNSLTHAYTCGSGSNRLLVVGFLGDSIGGNDDITGVTYASIAMTLAVKKTTGGTNRLQYIYYLLNPASGSNNVVISCTNNHYLIAVAADYTGVKQSGQPDATNTNISGTAGATTLTTSVTTVADNSWAILLESSYQGGPAATAGTGATFRIAGAAFGEPSIFDSNGAVHPAGSYSMTTNAAATFGFYIMHTVASFAPAPAYPFLERKTRGLMRGIYQG